jgi:excisionase family DNA binding protein
MVANELLSAQEVAARIGVTERTVRRWIKQGDLPATRRGRSYEIDLGAARSLAPSSSNGHRRSTELVAALARRDRDYALLEGRYLELKDHHAAAQRELQEERMRRIELETRAGAPLQQKYAAVA